MGAGAREGAMGVVRRVGALLAAVVTMAILAAGCSQGAATEATTGTVSRANVGVVENDDKPKPGGQLVYGLLAETNGWNPALNQWAPSGIQVTHAFFDTLTAYDEQSQIKPFLAASMDHNADYSEWTFTLRPGVKLHNGKPVTADVIVRNQTFLMRSPVTGPAYKYALVESFTKKDDMTVAVHLQRGSAIWPVAMATQLGVVADPDWLESNDGLHPIGTGPFAFDAWQIDKQLTVKRNPDYWQVDKDGMRLPYLDSIEFRVITDSESRGKSLQAKDIDVMETMSGQQVQSFQKADGFQVYSDSKGESREQFVMLNLTADPLNDLDVRRALAYATDKQTFTEISSAGFDEVANGPIAPSSPWFAATDYPQHDPAKAIELVQRAKARHGGSIRFTLRGVSNPDTQVATQTLQQQWSAVGIDVDIDLQEQAKLIIGVVAGDYQAVMWSQFDAPNPYADGVWWDPRGAVPPPEFALNFARNDDPEIGVALIAGGTNGDLREQRAQFAIVQQRLAADVPYVWLTHQRMSVVASDRVVNLVRASLPDGSLGLDLHQGAHALAQIWLSG